MPLLSVSERQPNGTPVLDEGEELIHTEDNVAFFFDVSQSEGVGVLYITSKHIIWLSTVDAGKGYSLDSYFIGVHAISNDTSFFSYPCIYCQLESEITPEIRLVPQQTDRLSNLYEAICAGAILNPDVEEEGEGDFIFNKEEVEMGSRGEHFFPVQNGDAMESVTHDMEGLTTADDDDRFADDNDDVMNGH